MVQPALTKLSYQFILQDACMGPAIKPTTRLAATAATRRKVLKLSPTIIIIPKMVVMVKYPTSKDGQENRKRRSEGNLMHFTNVMRLCNQRGVSNLFYFYFEWHGPIAIQIASTHLQYYWLEKRQRLILCSKLFKGRVNLAFIAQIIRSLCFVWHWDTDQKLYLSEWIKTISYVKSMEFSGVGNGKYWN